MQLLRIYVLLISVIFCFPTLAHGVAVLPTNEVEALQQIGKTLGKTNWDFSVDPCTGNSDWDSPIPPGQKVPTNSVKCNCTFLNNTVCHVVKIFLKEQNLGGSLPVEIVNLPFLDELDLKRNYLNGTIPPEWGSSTQLQKISLIGNRLSGSIPKELANISTLTRLDVEFNQLSGVIPPELGNLTSLEYMFLTSNNLSGELPLELGKLIAMKDFRIGDNNFMGKIPSFIQNWFNLSKLFVEASGLEGPIPNAISTLTNMKDLRISDISGVDSFFPHLNNLINLEILSLRSCNLIGPFPDLSTLTNLQTLDLSFNKLVGEIPTNYSFLSKTNYIYLTGNLLNGIVPDWLLNHNNIVDLSYNNFNSIDTTSGCAKRQINLFASNSENLTYESASCLRISQCQKDLDSLYINCGGSEVIIGSTRYEGDTDRGGPSNFYRGSNWAFSSTGNFMDDDPPINIYFVENTSKLLENSSELSMNARITPISLTYYGFCLMNGKYNVKLHFAEIAFTNDKTYKSLGRRIFDVYIQGKRVLKDFNIEKEAGGAGIEIVEDFQVVVPNRTMEIRFHWSGKGTVGMPTRGVYGPLISAISVQLLDVRQNTVTGEGISIGAIIGIVFSVFVIILILGVLWRKGYIGHRSTTSQDLKEMDLQIYLFSMRQIKTATNNFDDANKIGEGGFGPVYKGILLDGTVVAVKQLSSRSKQGNHEFVNEIGMISTLRHPYLVRLHGCCIEGNQLLLVYEYMENNSLANALFGTNDGGLFLDWSTRYKICIGIARGLAFLHEESKPKIVHRDIKATNVLLDKDLNPKISDFGLAKLNEEDKTHLTTRVAGTYGYIAPEYAMHGYLTDKADVYSFGIVALEVVSGICNTMYRPEEDYFSLLDYAHVLRENETLTTLVDRKLGLDFNQEEAMVMINIALICTNVAVTARPTMSSVVSMLEDRRVPENLLLDLDLNVYRKVKRMNMMNQQQTDMDTEDSTIDSGSLLSHGSEINLHQKNDTNRNTC